MSALLKVHDEFFGTKAQDDSPPSELRLISERVSPREIIRERVLAEVAQVNAMRAKNAVRHTRTRSFLIDVEEGGAEERLNTSFPVARRKGKIVDAEEEMEKALKAFRSNRFVMLFDDRQVDDLDDELTVMPGSEVTFLYLTPLKGG